MKKLFLSALLLAGTCLIQAQDMKFGLKAGVDLYTSKAKFVNPISGATQTFTASGTGFYVGGFISFPMSEKIAIQPELAYVAVENSGFLNLPILAKYELAEKIHVLAGPCVNYFLDADEDEIKLNVDLGAAYDITEKIDINARYSLGFGDITFSGIFIGANYSF